MGGKATRKKIMTLKIEEQCFEYTVLLKKNQFPLVFPKNGLAAVCLVMIVECQVFDIMKP